MEEVDRPNNLLWGYIGSNFAIITKANTVKKFAAGEFPVEAFREWWNSFTCVSRFAIWETIRKYFWALNIDICTILTGKLKNLQRHKQWLANHFYAWEQGSKYFLKSKVNYFTF